MSPDKNETDTKGGRKDRKTGTAFHKFIPGLPPCAKHLRWGPLTYKSAPGSPGSTATIPVVKSKVKASTHTSPNMLQLGEVQYVGHTSKYRAPAIYPQQVNPWPPHSSLAHGEWNYNAPSASNMQGGFMRILGGDMVTSVRGVETMIKPEDFLKLSDEDRRALVTAGYTQYNNGNIPPPPPPPPPRPKSDIAKTKALTKAPSITPSESISSAPDRKEKKKKKKCALCSQAARMPEIDEAEICTACLHYHSYLLAENSMKHSKRTK